MSNESVNEISFWKRYLQGWSFRSSNPELSSGEEYSAYVSQYESDSETNIIRIGDTKIQIENGINMAGLKIKFVVTEFDSSGHIGKAKVLETVGEATF